MGYRYLSTSRGAGNETKFPLLSFSMYRYLSTLRGAGNIELLPAKLAELEYSYLSTSREVGNSLTCTITRLPSWNCVQIPIYLARGRKRFSFHLSVSNQTVQLPIYLARGRKQVSLATLFFEKMFSIATYLPREGPETNAILQDHLHTRTYRYLSTSRGAGNIVKRNESTFKLQCIAPYLPREGPEPNILPRLCQEANTRVQLPIYLERGRKRYQ